MKLVLTPYPDSIIKLQQKFTWTNIYLLIHDEFHSSVHLHYQEMLPVVT